MKRKDFVKSFIGLMVAPTVIAEVAKEEPKKLQIKQEAFPDLNKKPHKDPLKISIYM